jgi:ketol-acid reductoisomerase
MMYEGGISWMRYSVSDTAEYGDYVSGPRVINESSKDAMKDILAEIRDGSFANRFMAEIESGGEYFTGKRAEAQQHPIEVVGKQLRAMMPFIETPTELG